MDPAGTAKVGIDVADHTQSLLLKDWQSGTVAIFVVLFLVVLLLYVLEVRSHRADIRLMATETNRTITAYRNSNLRLVQTIKELMPHKFGSKVTEVAEEPEHPPAPELPK